MDGLVRKRGRPIKVGSKRRRLYIRITDDEYEILCELSKIKNKSFTDILLDGLRRQYDECSNADYEYYDDYDY